MAEHLLWNRLPAIPQTTTEYLHGNREVISLLRGDFRSLEMIKTLASRRVKDSYPRGLGEAIREEYQGEELPARLERSLELLERGEAFAVVTGQQLGLFGGPLYTFYKCLSTITLAHHLTERLSHPVVPIFWMENTDSDFEEVSSINLPHRQDAPVHLSYSPMELIEGKIIALHQLNERIVPLLASLKEYLNETHHSQRVLKVLEGGYQPGLSLTTGFHRLLKGFFGEEGLVAINPRSPAILSLTIPFWERVWERPTRLNSAIAIASRTLTDLNLPLQVPFREGVLPIFYIDEGGIRHRMSLEEEEVHLGRSGQKVSVEVVRRWAQESPEKFSPSALLRPLLQDFLLPTVAYVAGPSEIAYHCQSGALYDLLEIPHPVVFPRLSATLVEPFVRRILERHHWTVEDALGGQEILLYQRGPSLQSFDDLFHSGAAHLQAWLERISHALEETYPPVDASLELDRARRKLSYQWWKLHNIVKKKLSERDEVRVRHSQLVSRHLLPQGVLQERFYSPLYYLAQYGISELERELLREYDPWNPYHLIVYLQ